MVNVNHRCCSITRLKSIVQQSSLTGDDVPNTTYTLAREEGLEMLSSMAVKIMPNGHVMRVC